MVNITDTTLLDHLHRTETSLPLPTIQGSIAFYLAHIAPYPTSFAATVISSPFFRQLSHSKLQVLNTAFRYATHLKYNVDRDAPGYFFSRSLGVGLEAWVSAVLAGIHGGGPVVKLACCGGILVGMDDLKTFGSASIRGNLEAEVVVALAEVMDTFQQLPGAWEKEFQPTAGDEDPLALALILASQSVPLVSSEKLKTLPLHVFARLLLSTIDSAFHHGTFLTSLASSSSPDAPVMVQISSVSPFARNVQLIASSALLSHIGPLSRLCARTQSLLLDLHPDSGMASFAELLQTMCSLVTTVELDWAASSLSSVTNENDIAPDSRELSKTVWMLLKTLLFSTTMIIEAPLSTLVFVSPSRAQTSSLPSLPSVSVLARTILNLFSHLSFVISRFGGVTADGGFSELKKVFYLALDILAADGKAAETYVRELCSFDNGEETPARQLGCRHPSFRAKKAYSLACIEQLVPLATEISIEFHILPCCLPYLSDTTYREIFESSHSIMLAILASHTQRIGEHYTTLIRKLVSFYAPCLIENSAPGMLSTPQLRLAFSILVRCAGSGVDVDDAWSPTDDRCTLPWFCIESLLSALHAWSERGDCEEHLHRLRLALISTISSLSLRHLPLVLNEIGDLIVERGTYHPSSLQKADVERRMELVETLYEEISERVTSKEKEFAIRWWYKNRKMFLVAAQAGASPQSMMSSL